MSRFMSGTLRAIAIGAAIHLGATALASAQDLKRVTITQTGEGFWYAVQYVAEAMGYYKDAGLEIDLVHVQSGSRQVAAVMGGSALVTSVNLENAITATQKGGNLVAISAMFSEFPMAILLSNAGLEKSGITPDMPVDEKVNRLKGLKIAITSPGSGSDKFIRALLTARGINADTDLELQPIGSGTSQLAALESGLVDGFIWGAPFPESAQVRGLGQIVIDSLDGEAPEYTINPYIALLTSPAAIESNRQELLGLVTAYARAMRYIQENKEETRQIVRAKLQDIEEDAFNLAFDKYLAAVPKTPVITPEQFATTVNSMNSRNPDAITVSFEEVINVELANEAVTSLGSN